MQLVVTALGALAISSASATAASQFAEPVAIGAGHRCSLADQEHYQRAGYACIKVTSGGYRLAPIVAEPATRRHELGSPMSLRSLRTTVPGRAVKPAGTLLRS